MGMGMKLAIRRGPAPMIRWMVGGLLIAAGLIDGDSAAARSGATAVTVVENGYGFLLGGVEGGRFVGAAAVAPTVTAGQTLDLYGLQGKTGSVRTTVTAQPVEPCQDAYGFDITPEVAQPLVGVGAGPGQLMPRKLPETLGLTSPAYVAAAADVLRGLGIAKPTVQLTQLVRTDLEADGVDEVILVSDRHQSEEPWAPAAGDHSVIAVRRVVAGQVKVDVLGSDVYPAAAEGAPPTTFRLLAVLDLDRDGTAEIIYGASYYEGASYGVFQLQAGRFVEIESLAFGCGL